MKLTLPFPPSVNSYWRSPNKGALAGRTLISANGRKYRSDATYAVLKQLKRYPQPIAGSIEVHLTLYPPTTHRRDLDNFQKALFDSLTHVGVWKDDSQIKRMLVEWGAVTCHGKAEITITPFSGAAS